MQLTRWTLFGVLTFLLLPAASASEIRPPDPLFQDTAMLDVRIVAPISTLESDRSSDEELPGTLQYVNEAGETVEFNIKIRTRGRFRRLEEVCDFPPIRLNFKASETKDTLFHKQDKVKLVTHCQGGVKYEQVILREYTAYRILNTLTNLSFRVRLLRITYVDSDGKKRDDVNHGFIIEHRDRLAKRHGMEHLDIEETRAEDLHPGYTNLVSMYHYLIGNTDFSAVLGSPGNACCHNHILLGDDASVIWSVPYDFDQSGLVNAPHGGPAVSFNLRNVRQRLYRGRCLNNGELAATFATFNEKREDIMAVLQEVEDASSSSEKTMVKYAERFYGTIESERRRERDIVKACI